MVDLAQLELRVTSLEVVEAERRLRRFTGRAGEAERGARRLERRNRELNTGFGRLRQTIGSVARSLGAVALSFAAVAGVRDTLTFLGDFEQALVGIAKTAGLNDAQLQRVEDRLQQVGSGLQTPILELVRFGEVAGQLGIQGVDNINRFAETIAQLEIAAPTLVGEEAALALARLLNLADEGARTIPKLGSVLVELGNNSAATEKEIVRAATFIGQSLATFKLGSADVLALATAVTEVGQRAETSATALARSFIEIDRAVKVGGDSLERFAAVAGVSAEEFAASFEQDKIRGFQLFVEGIDRLTRAGGNVQDILDFVGIRRSIEAVRVLGAVSARFDLLQKDVALARNELEDLNALQDEVARASATLNAAIGRLQNTFKVLTEDLLDEQSGFKGALRDSINFITDIVRSLADLEVAADRNTETLQNVVQAVRALGVALGALLVVVTLKVALAALGATIAALLSPIGLVIAAIGTLAVLFFRFRDEVIQVGDVSTTVGQTLAVAFEVALDRAAAAFRAFSIAAQAALRVVVRLFQETLSGIQEGFVEPLGEALDSVGITFGDVFTAVLVSARGFANDVIGTFVGTINFIAEEITRLVQLGQAVANIDLGSPAAALESLRDVGTALNRVINPGEQARVFVTEFSAALERDFIGEVLGPIQNVGSQIRAVLSNFGGDAGREFLANFDFSTDLEGAIADFEARVRGRNATTFQKLGAVAAAEFSLSFVSGVNIQGAFTGRALAGLRLATFGAEVAASFTSGFNVTGALSGITADLRRDAEELKDAFAPDVTGSEELGESLEEAQRILGRFLDNASALDDTFRIAQAELFDVEPVVESRIALERLQEEVLEVTRALDEQRLAQIATSTSADDINAANQRFAMSLGMVEQAAAQARQQILDLAEIQDLQDLITAAERIDQEFEALFRTDRENRLAEGIRETEEAANSLRRTLGDQIALVREFRAVLEAEIEVRELEIEVTFDQAELNRIQSEIDGLNQQLELSLVSEEQLQRDLASIEQFVRDANERLRELETLAQIRGAARDISEAFGQAFGDIVTGASTAREAAINLISQIQQALVQRVLVDPLVDQLTSGLTNVGAGIFGIEQDTGLEAGAATTAQLLTAAGTQVGSSLTTSASTASSSLAAGGQAAAQAILQAAQQAAQVLSQSQATGVPDGATVPGTALAGAGAAGATSVDPAAATEDAGGGFLSRLGGIFSSFLAPLGQLFSSLLTSLPQALSVLFGGGGAGGGLGAAGAVGGLGLGLAALFLKKGGVRHRGSALAFARGAVFNGTTDARADVVPFRRGVTLGRGVASTIAATRSVPLAQMGEIVDRPMMMPQALVGEGTRPEGIFPLDTIAGGGLGVPTEIRTGQGIQKTALRVGRLGDGNLGLRLTPQDLGVTPFQLGGLLDDSGGSEERFQLGSGVPGPVGAGTGVSGGPGAVTNVRNVTVNQTFESADPNAFRSSAGQGAQDVKRRFR